MRRKNKIVKGIGHAAFVVKDMEKTVAFYEETLGFKRAFDIPRPTIPTASRLN